MNILRIDVQSDSSYHLDFQRHFEINFFSYGHVLTRLHSQLNAITDITLDVRTRHVVKVSVWSMEYGGIPPPSCIPSWRAEGKLAFIFNKSLNNYWTLKIIICVT